MKIRTISGRKAITVMIAPSWFWKKNLARSDSRAGIVLVGRLPHQAAGDREDRDPDQDADQQRQVAVVELVLAEQDDPGDFAADGDDPRERGENAEALGGGLLAVRRAPFLGDVDVFGRLVVGHVRFPQSTLLHADQACGSAASVHHRRTAKRPSQGGSVVVAQARGFRFIRVRP